MKLEQVPGYPKGVNYVDFGSLGNLGMSLAVLTIATAPIWAPLLFRKRAPRSK